MLDSLSKKSSNAPTENDSFSIPDLRVQTKWIVGLVLMALVMRIINLNSGLWLDEIYSLIDFFRVPIFKVFTEFVRDNQHPFYSVLANLSLKIFGDYPWAIRLPAVLFGVVTVPALYLLGTVVTTKREAFFSTAFLAVSYHHVWFSQNARGYTGLALCTILTSYLLIRGLQRQQKVLFTWYAIIAAFGVYIHLTMVFVVVSHFLVCVALQTIPNKSGRRFHSWQLPLFCFTLSGVISMFLYGPILLQVIDFFLNKPSEMVALSTPLWAVKEAIRVLKLGFGPAGIVLFLGVIVFIAGLWSYYRTNPLAFAIFLVPTLVMIIGALAARGTMYPRLFFCLIGFGILIGIRGAMVSVRWIVIKVSNGTEVERKAILGGTALIIFLIVMSTTSLVHNYRFPKMDFEGAMRWVETQDSDNARIVTAGVVTWPYQNYFEVSWPSIQNRDELVDHLRDVDQIWVIYALPRYLAHAAPDLMKAIQNNSSEQHRFRGTLHGGDIIACRFESSKVLKENGEWQ